MLDNLEKYLGEYIEECMELLDAIDNDFLEIENNPDTVRDKLNSIYRALHTIKGSSQLFGINHIGTTAHGLETGFDIIRSGKFPLTKTLVDKILICVEYIRNTLEALNDPENKDKNNLNPNNETYQMVFDVLNLIFEPVDLHLVEQEKFNDFFNYETELKFSKGLKNGDLPSHHDVKVSEDSSSKNDDSKEDPLKELINNSMGGFFDDDEPKQSNPKTTSPQDERKDSQATETVAAAKPAASKPNNKFGAFDSPVLKSTPKPSPASTKYGAFDSPALKSPPKATPASSKFGAFDSPILKSTAKQTGLKDLKDAEINSPKLKIKENNSASTNVNDEKSMEANEATIGLQSQKNKPLNPTHDSANDTIRVPVELLNHLMNLTGELILIRNQLTQLGNDRQIDDSLIFLGQNLSVLTNKLQNEVLRTRLQPIGTIYTKLKRSIRRISSTLGKNVDVELIGDTTEVDKNILGSLEEPLIHIVNYTIESSIENSMQRKQAGKSAKGKLQIIASREGGQVIIKINDDGNGVDFNKISQAALKSGVISAKDQVRMDPESIAKLLFIKDVWTNLYPQKDIDFNIIQANDELQQIGGTIDLNSSENGNEFTIKVPLTLTILPALIVKSGEAMFSIPQSNLMELVRVGSEDNSIKIEWINNTPIYRQRGQIIPLVYLNESLSGQYSYDRKNLDVKKDVNVLVLKTSNNLFGLVVDEIVNSIDIVVKPLMNALTKSSFFSGATILGDGSIALILDPFKLISFYNLSSHETNSISLNNEDFLAQKNKSKNNSSYRDFLLVDLGIRGFYGIRLDNVNRLEEFDCQNIFYSGDRQVVNYRSKVMPLITSKCLLKTISSESTIEENNNTKKFIVFNNDNIDWGLEVQEFMDIISTKESLDDNIDNKNIEGLLIYNDKVINIIDIEQIIKCEHGMINQRKVILENDSKE